MGLLDNLLTKSQRGAAETAKESLDLNRSPFKPQGVATGNEIDRAARAVRRPVALKPAKRDVREMLDELGMGDSCKEAFEIARDIARGKLNDPANPGALVRCTVKERFDAAVWLAEMANGKPGSSVDVSVTRTERTEYDLSLFNDRELELLEQLLTRAEPIGPGESLGRRAVPSEIVDGEIIPPTKED